MRAMKNSKTFLYRDKEYIIPLIEDDLKSRICQLIIRTRQYPLTSPVLSSQQVDIAYSIIMAALEMNHPEVKREDLNAWGPDAIHRFLLIICDQAGLMPQTLYN